MQFCFHLVKDSLMTLYEPVWGWNDAKKHQQLSHVSSRFILARPSPGSSDPLPAAYINYRIEAYEGKPSVYLYEVMVTPGYQRMGLGSRMMQLVEEMAWSLGLDQVLGVVLTEFVANKAANAFYKKLGFKTDPSSPRSPSCGYVILSKQKQMAKS